MIGAVRGNPRNLRGSPALVTMRFRHAAFMTSAIPVRRATVTNVEAAADDYRVYFRLGPMFDFRAVQQLSDAVQPLGEAFGKDGLEEIIFFRTPGEMVERTAQMPEAALQDVWVRWIELVSEDADVPVNPLVKDSIFMRFETPRRWRRRRVSKVHGFSAIGPTYAVKVPERSSQDLTVVHRIPALIGTQVGLPQGLQLSIESSPQNIDFVPDHSTISANYDSHVVKLTPTRRSGDWQQLALHPEPMTSQAGPTTLNGVELIVPLRVRIGWRYQLRANVFPFLAVAAALIFSAYVAQYNADHPKNHISLTWSVLASVGAALALLLFRK